MSILERRKQKAANLTLAAPVAALAVLGIAATRAHATAIGSGDILVYQGGSSTTDVDGVGGSTLLINELNPNSPSNTPVQSFNITSTEGVYTNNNGSNGILALSENGSLLTFGGYVGTNSSNELTQPGRDAIGIDASGNVTMPANYTESAANGQTRSAYSPDGSNWYFGDKNGIYFQNSTTPANSTNVRLVDGFGGTLYAAIQGNNSTSGIFTVSSNGSVASTQTISTNKNITDFILLQSGQNGSTYDTAYVADGSSILKFYLANGTWTAAGSYSAGSAAIDAITAEETANGVELFTTVSQVAGTSAAYVEQYTDTAAYNAAITVGSGSSIYTAPLGDDLFGISLAPTAVPEPASLGIIFLGGAALLTRRRRRARA